MKHELGLILKKYEGKQADFSQLRAMFHDIDLLHESLPDFVAESCNGSISTSDFKYAKMQTVHQLLVNTVSRSTESTDQAIDLARMVDAAFGAIDSQPETAKASPVGDIDLDAADFSDALMWLKEGRKVARRGWNGKGMFLWLVPAGEYPARMEAIKGHYPDDMVPYGGYIAMKTAGGNVVPWLASQTDMLADDWLVVS